MTRLNVGPMAGKLSGIFDFLNGVKISIRIGILAALGATSVVVLGATYLVGDIGTSAAAVKQQDNEELAELAMSVEIGALQMRRNEKDFLLRKDAKYIERYETSVTNVLVALGEMKTLEVASELAEEITIIEQGIAAHAEQFRLVVSLHERMGLTETEGLQGALRSAVHSVETKLEDAAAPALTIKMLQMRRHEKDFLLRGDEKYIGRIGERRVEFDAILRTLEQSDASALALGDEPSETSSAAVANRLPVGFKQEISSLLDEYQRGVQAYAATALKVTAETKKLSEIFAEMVPAFERTSDTASIGLSNAEKALNAIKSITGAVFLSVGLLVLAVVIVFGFAVGRSITDSLQRITSVMSTLADGNTDIDVPYLDNKHEIGEMAHAVEVFRGNALERQKLEAEQAEHQAAREQRTRKVDEMISAFDAKSAALLDAVSASSTDLHDTAGAMTQTAEATSSRASAASGAAEIASSNVQTVASAAEELHSAIAEIGRQVVQSTDISQKTTSAAEQTGEKMGQLEEAAEKIGAVINLIQDIAEQTNLLALNATIEAARAGDAGKGFAVVAGEVKSLANQTAKATEEISTQISTMQSSTKDAVSAIDQVNGMISQMSEIATAISSAVEQQGAATQEIASSVQEAARGTSDVTSNIAEVDAVTVENTQAAQKVNTYASDLSGKSDELRQEVEVFLKSVKAA